MLSVEDCVAKHQDMGLSISFKETEYISAQKLVPFKQLCPELDHRVRLNVASQDALRKVLSEKEYESLVKIHESIPFVTDFSQLKPMNLDDERAFALREQVILKGNARFAPAELLAKIPDLGPSGWLLFLVVSAEYLGVGLGTAAFVAFIATKTNRAYTAAQFALLTSISGLPRTFASSITGYLIVDMGYTGFFVFCTGLAVPGMLLLFTVAPWNEQTEEKSEQAS